MAKTTLGIISVASAVLLSASFANLSAQESKKAGKQLACAEIKDEFACKGYSDCQWVGASGKKKAGCANAAKKRK